MHEEMLAAQMHFTDTRAREIYLFLKYNIWAAQRLMNAFKKVTRTSRLLGTNEGIKMQRVHDDMMQMQKKGNTEMYTAWQYP